MLARVEVERFAEGFRVVETHVEPGSGARVKATLTGTWEETQRYLAVLGGPPVGSVSPEPVGEDLGG